MRLTPSHARPAWVDGVRWTFNPDVRVQSPDELHFDALRDTGRVERVKEGPHRGVYRVRLRGGIVYWKHCRIYSTRAFLRECFRPPKARLEFDKALSLAARGVPTVRPLAWGVRSRSLPCESFLITEALDGTVALTQYLEQTLPTLPHHEHRIARRVLALALGRFMALLHDKGVSHPDLHPGNLLLDWQRGSEPRFYLIDLHAIRVGRPLSRRASRENLVLLNRWFLLRAERTDRLRFWHEYSRRRGFARSDALVWERATWDSNRRFWRTRDRRCLGNNRYFQRVRSAVAAGHVVREIDRRFLDQLLADPDGPFRDSSATILKDSRSATVAEVSVPTAEGLRRMVYKRFRVTSWHDPLANLLRQSPALRSWQLGHGLRDRGLATPRPWLVLHRRRWGLPAEGYLLCEKVSNVGDLQAYASALAAKPAAEQRAAKRSLIDRVARLVRALHQRQVSHRDLKAANLLLRARPAVVTPQGPDLEPVFVDLVGAHVHRRLTQGRMARNLARLHASFHDSPVVSRTDKLRFLRMYMNWAVSGKQGWKGWWRQVDQATRAKVAGNARRGRPLA